MKVQIQRRHCVLSKHSIQFNSIQLYCHYSVHYLHISLMPLVCPEVTKSFPLVWGGHCQILDS